MTPQEKAKELVSIIGKKIGKEFKNGCFKYNIEVAKQCAIIAVDEIIDLLPNINLIAPIHRKSDEFYFQYWNIVKKEIEKL